MKVPAKPPAFDDLMRRVLAGNKAVEAMMSAGRTSAEEYVSYDKVSRKAPPDGLTTDEWWFGLKMVRRSAARELDLLRDTDGRHFSYNLPDTLLRSIDEINRSASGSIAMPGQVTNPATRDRYIVSSLIEEAITSSQLEGASTTRRVAKEMLRSGRSPRTKSERMIRNNYLAMRAAVELRDTALTPELVCDLHRVVTDGTLDDPASAGRLQDDQDQRISIWGDGDQLLHTPPPVDELPDRLNRLCTFANHETADEAPYLPPVLRSLAIHFMVGYDHYFEDGNGRTARALFYWSMLRQGYWLTEFLTISTILKRAPSQYARSFLLTEDDDGDMTYFFLYHLDVVTRAIDALNDYLARKAEELLALQTRMSALAGFNHRQGAVLEHAVKNPGATYTAQSHARSHAVTTQTARTDLGALEDRGLLTHVKVGRRQVWSAVPDLPVKLR